MGQLTDAFSLSLNLSFSFVDSHKLSLLQATPRQISLMQFVRKFSLLIFCLSLSSAVRIARGVSKSWIVQKPGMEKISACSPGKAVLSHLKYTSTN